MSDYCNVKFCNLKMTREQALKIIKEYNEVAERKVGSIETFLNMIGLEYDYSVVDDSNENLDTIVPVIGGEYYEGYDFVDILNIIARNIDNDKRYILISKSYEYDETVKYVFYNGKVETVYQVRMWQDNMDNDLI